MKQSQFYSMSLQGAERRSSRSLEADDCFAGAREGQEGQVSVSRRSANEPTNDRLQTEVQLILSYSSAERASSFQLMMVKPAIGYGGK